ncbi:histidine-rich carboxyl terminus protein 1 [Hoplias malabaricus]|uniref:histidine-rich carboxyl terminus protein 1 n=1 Tax=Hoplias malabaricus TaxID=27720 RepID=UPI0034623B18
MWCVALLYQHTLCTFGQLMLVSPPKHSQVMVLLTVLACLCLVTSAAVTAQSDYTVACYVDASTRRLFLHVNSSICTHLISSSAYIGDDSSFKTSAQDPDTGCTSLKTVKERNPALKTWLGVEVKQSRLELLTQNQATLKDFTYSTLEYLKEKNYDGLELTWLENTGSDEPPKTTEALICLLKELKESIDEDPGLSNKGVHISVSLPDSADNISTHSDEETLSQYADFISLMPTNLKNEETQIDNAVQYWKDKSVDPKKLIVALPALLRKSRRREHRRHSEIVDLNPDKEEQPYGPRLMIAKQVCQAIKSGQTELRTLTKLESAQSLGEEVSWLLQKGLGGVGVVVLDLGTFTDSICFNCTEREKAILESKVLSGSLQPHHSHGHDSCSRCGRHPHGHHHRHHHHHHDRDNSTPDNPVQSNQDDQSSDSNDTGHHRGAHHHGHRHHARGQHGHFHHGRGHQGHGHHGRGQYRHGHEGHSHDDPHSST